MTKMTEAGPTGPARILIVDDEPEIINALRRFLKREGYEVATAGCAEEALRVLDEIGPVDLVISDHNMPKISGIAMMDTIRRKHPEATRVLLSAHCDVHSAADAINDGLITRFILKPWREEELTTVVHLALRDGRLLRETRAVLDVMDHIEADPHRSPADAQASSRRMISSMKRLLEAHERRITWGA